MGVEVLDPIKGLDGDRKKFDYSINNNYNMYNK